MTSNTALQVTNFNFYGDELIALKDNATGEIYTSINSVLRGIGFTDKNQIRKRRDKWINDIVLAKGIEKFILSTQEVVSKNGTTLFDEKETYCISHKKLPLALAKINITPSMKKTQKQLVEKLELYQDKCADVLASVFINHRSTDQIAIQPVLDSLAKINDNIMLLATRIIALEKEQNQLHEMFLEKKKSYWFKKMSPKYKLLMEHFKISSNSALYRELYKEFHNLHPEIDLDQLVNDYCYENKLESCFTLDAIEHDKDIRKLFENMVDSLLVKNGIARLIKGPKQTTIFDK